MTVWQPGVRVKTWACVCSNPSRENITKTSTWREISVYLSVLQLLLQFIRWMLGYVHHTLPVQWHLQGFSRNLKVSGLCVWVFVCSLPLMRCWHVVGRSLLSKKNVSGCDWVPQFNTVSIQPACADKPIHAHTVQSLFKRQTRALLLS